MPRPAPEGSRDPIGRGIDRRGGIAWAIILLGLVVAAGVILVDHATWAALIRMPWQ